MPRWHAVCPINGRRSHFLIIPELMMLSGGTHPGTNSIEAPGFYRDALETLLGARIPFLVGGGYALQLFTGVARMTKDFDIFVLRDDIQRALACLSLAGYGTELTYPHWLGKAFSKSDFIDLIFNSGNACCPVDA